ncbi:ABC transporter ATP-binding protein [Microbacterium sp. dk485]|uniref:ABC transporter ATP-binding protein n=1 Tax=Microbacterium sp. dk485 TaxID=2560021 RepID=UPI0010740EA5|nr:ABC transporter ATP-binding protein [Microbacterium sp. dk485]TFV81006.1 ABC transporter ATP-binding protein [Microbacterium sp. dk485]
MTMLIAENLRARYGGVQVLHGVDLAIEEGEIVALLGANGAGKTTLLRALSRQVASSGAITLAGTRIDGLSTARVARLGLGHVPEGRGTFTELTVEENLRLGALARPRNLRARTAADLDLISETFPVLHEMRSRQAGALSGGQAQMLAVARALLARPRLLLVDEPSLGLAPLTTLELFNRFQSLRDAWSLTILLAEQNARLSLRIADRAIVLSRGSVALEGPAAELQDHDSLRAAYLGDAHSPAATSPSEGALDD